MRALWPVACLVSTATRAHGAFFLPPPASPTQPRPRHSAARPVLFCEYSTLDQSRARRPSAHVLCRPGLRVFAVNARRLDGCAAPPPSTAARRSAPRHYKLPVVLDQKEMVVRHAGKLRTQSSPRGRDPRRARCAPGSHACCAQICMCTKLHVCCSLAPGVGGDVDPRRRPQARNILRW